MADWLNIYETNGDMHIYGHNQPPYTQRARRENSLLLIYFAFGFGGGTADFSNDAALRD
jgi:hypothetical protein